MRTLFVAAILCLGLKTSAIAQEAKIHWMTVEEVEEAMKTEPKKVMMDVYTAWCGPCKMMMANTFTNPNVISYINKNYYAVKFNAEHPSSIMYKGKEFKNPTYDPNRRGRNGVHELSRALKVSAYPTIVYFDEEFTIITANSGYKQPGQLEMYLKFFKEVFTREIPSENIQSVWDKYSSNFAGSW
jgi:thioredoxin-related protein